ncbi:MAG TPA: cyclic nucleotide-binding domain-containing protein [Bacteriovoracaceae bacterium]|nr:cyclic nucleotide-binding domain-containing protein [Bacteriovoracaceae bacterium]
MAPAGASTRSGLKQLKPGEIIFNENESADSLFIIQKGQVRLYRPKGKGFVELAVLRAGEVIGEMAYFDEDGSGRKRSCSASAITPVEIIEVSFVAFGKTMQSLNPWFKTIINTLVGRLKKTNSRIREIEDNQTSVSYGKATATYEFMKPLEVMKVLGTLFLVFKAHGEAKSQALMVGRKTLTLYTMDMYQIIEVKLETIINLLVQLGWMEVKEDEEQLPNLLFLKNIDIVRQIFIFYNSERHLPDNKKMEISEKCEMLIAKVIEKAPANPLIDISNQKVTEDSKPKFTKYYDITAILEEFKGRNISINSDHVSDGSNVGLFGEVVIMDGQVLAETDFPKIQKMYPIIRFINAVKKMNIEKATAS